MFINTLNLILLFFELSVNKHMGHSFLFLYLQTTYSQSYHVYRLIDYYLELESRFPLFAAEELYNKKNE